MTTTQPEAQPSTSVRPGRDGRAATPVVAFLGTGRMGGPMAANLARAGFRVRAWDRTASHAAALVKDGATAAASPAEAVKGAQILITMLADGPATDQLWNGPDGLTAAGPGLIWVQMATVGTEWTQRFASTAARYGVSFVDAPGSGSQGPARAGQLTILASGPHGCRTSSPRCSPRSAGPPPGWARPETAPGRSRCSTTGWPTSPKPPRKPQPSLDHLAAPYHWHLPRADTPL